MFSLDEKFFYANSSQQSVQTLIIGRLFAIFLLLVTAWIWFSGQLHLSIERLPRSLFLVFIVSIGLTVVYFLLLRLSKAYLWQVRLQFAMDVLLITWLVWRTGDVTSPYIVLYLVLISVSSLYLKPVGTLIMSCICLASLAVIAAMTGLGIIGSADPTRSVARLAQALSFNAVAMLIVGMLAAKLSERMYSGKELAAATKDLADLRALHERIVECIRSGLITTDLEGRIYTFNAAAAEITGYSAQAMLGRPISALFGDISEPIQQSLDQGEGSEQLPRFEASLTTPDGFAVRIGYNISQLLSEENEPTGLIITFQDLTEIRSMEESVRRKERLAAVGRVGAGLAHEIRNPLGAMRGAIQVLESNTPAESVQADLMKIILRESDRLNTIITNFLNYARPQAGKFLEVDVGEAIRETVALLKHGPDVSPEHDFLLDVPLEPVVISADATQLKQIFWNVARNAIQAMPGGGRLTVRLQQIPGRRIRIVFEDTGRGMSPDAVEQLFEPFSSSTSGGTGLGLSIVYQIVRDHNGTINVRSIEGEGSTITIELPTEHIRAMASNGDEAAPRGNRLAELLKVKGVDSNVSS